jgi:uncharacterized protein
MGKVACATVNGHSVEADHSRGWIAIHCCWHPGDVVQLNMPMTVERVTMPPEFRDYVGLAALERGPIVFCIEQQDSPAHVDALCLPENIEVTPEHRPDFLGGVTVLKAALPSWQPGQDGIKSVPVTFVPYAVWDNRGPDVMRIWLPGRPGTMAELWEALASQTVAIDRAAEQRLEAREYPGV